MNLRAERCRSSRPAEMIACKEDYPVRRILPWDCLDMKKHRPDMGTSKTWARDLRTGETAKESVERFATRGME